MVNLATPPTEATPAKNSLSLVYRDAQQTLPQKIFQPLNLAILTSAVLHGVLGYGLPALPFLQQPNVPKEVRIMELTPQEQSRIRRDPQPLPPRVTGVPIPNSPSLGTTVNPGVPGTFPNNNFNNSGRVSGFPTYTPDNNFSYAPANPYQAGGFSGFRTNPQPEPQSEPRTGQRQTVITPRQPGPSSAPPVRTSDRFLGADNFATGNQTAFNRPFVPTPSVGAAPSPNSSPQPSPTSNGATGNGAIAPTPTPTNNNSVANNGNGTTGNGATGQPNSNPQSNPLLAFNPSNVDPSVDILRSNFASFLGTGDERLLIKENQVEITLNSIKYPLEACSQKLEGTTILGVITDAGGAITKAPAVLKSSGYEIFNQAAIAAANTYTPFTPTKVYIITVPFTYSPEACPNVSNGISSPQVTNNSGTPAPPGTANNNPPAPPKEATAPTATPVN